MRGARFVARAIGWGFVAVIAYHAGLAVAEAVQAAHDGNWPHAAELIAIAAVGTAIVVAALIGASSRPLRARSTARHRESRPRRRPRRSG